MEVWLLTVLQPRMQIGEGALVATAERTAGEYLPLPLGAHAFGTKLTYVHEIFGCAHA